MLWENRRRSQNAATEVNWRAPIRGAVNPASDGEAFIRAGRYAWFGVYPTLGEVKVVPSTEPKAVLEHRAPKTSPPILHTRGVESKVGRAVHCAPGLVMPTQLLELESCHPRPYGRGYELVICWCGKNTLLILHPAGRGLPALPAIGF